MVKITEGGDESYSDARGAGRNPNIGSRGQRTGQGGLPETFSDKAIYGALGRLQGDPERLIRGLKKELDKLPKKERAKAERKIRTLAQKGRQGKRGKRGRGDGGTPYIDSKNY